MVFLIVLFLCLQFVSCAKISYIVEQGVGQLKLQNRARENSVVLKDPLVASKSKKKIKLVQEYKSYFYDYFEVKETSIYSKTTILEDSAVSYLVIVSKHDKIKAREECFPIAGCFPYLGFFKKASAIEYQKKMNKSGFVTYLRPVYAYSTLGYFEDTILSSFFYFNEKVLAELIFHELFHTVFFIKDNVSLNENMANYIGREMSYEYFKFDQKKRSELEEKEHQRNQLKKLIVDLVTELQGLYDKQKNLTMSQSTQILDSFLESSFRPKIKKLCDDLKIVGKKCYPLEKKWNNASFSAYLTYEEKEQVIHKLRNQYGFGIKELFHFIKAKYAEYQNLDSDKKSFSDYLFSL
ncbi:MAG: hypothetical protein HOE90_08375 [Bacteriovoracaceae bacterium]|jgi:predicted aminopeptidase|nr:hypothetical protein [Bacteriovoracaceae bacterium]